MTAGMLIIFPIILLCFPQIKGNNTTEEPEVTTNMGRFIGLSKVKDYVPVPKMPGAATNVWESLKSQADSLDFDLNWNPKKALISEDPDLVRFLLYSDPNNPDKFEILKYKDEESIRASSYDPKKPVKFLIAGFTNNYNSTFPQNVKNAYLAKKDEMDANIIIVDWGPLSTPRAPYVADAFYPLAVKNTWTVGERVGEFIAWLKQSDLIDLDKVHIVGFSLGSHVSGKAGDKVKELTGSLVARITALDPAGPSFYTGKLARRIGKDDAQFVEALHTNAGQLGIWQDVGHVDFYINNGFGPQPNCFQYDTVQIGWQLILGSCSHLFATKSYAKTILMGSKAREEMKMCGCETLKGYTLTKNCCDKKVGFGEFASADSRGSYYMTYEL